MTQAGIMLPPFGLERKLALFWRVLTLKVREYLAADSRVFKKVATICGLVVGLLFWIFGQKLRGLSVLSSIHRAAYSGGADSIIESLVERTILARDDRKTSSENIYQTYISNLSSDSRTGKFFENPQRILGSRVLVLKSPQQNEKGVIVIDYSFTLPLFAKFFDVDRIKDRYYLVLEPSWSGYCDLDILCYAQYDFPIFIQTLEPRDTAFIRRTCRNLIPVPTSNNWWVDHRILRPLAKIRKDIDVIMVASWARFKRHHRFFSALAKLRAQGEKLTTVLIGYPTDCTRDDIFMLARYFGVADLVEMYEWLSPEEVNDQLNRAKVNVIWSRREGWNRAIVEGMFAGVPCVLREGHNYGFQYPYINSQTGCFAKEEELPERLLWMIKNYHEFSPREWGMANMTCQRATKILGEAIQRKADDYNEDWNQDLAVKVSHVNTMRYWENSDGLKFKADYDYLVTALKD